VIKKKMKPKSRVEEFKAGMRPTLKELKFTFGRIMKSPLSIIGFSIILFFALIAVFAPVLAPPVGLDPYSIFDDYNGPDPQPPGSLVVNQSYSASQALKAGYRTHIFGTIEGLDIYYGSIWGTIVAFKIGIYVVALTLIIGLAIGCISGYYGGAIDEIMMRLTDVIFAFPGLILAMAFVIALPMTWTIDIGLVAVAIAIIIAGALIGQFGLKLPISWSTLFGLLGAGILVLLQIVFKFSIHPTRLWLNDLDKVLVALIIVGWPGYTRVIRGEILKARQEDYVEAAKAVGCSDFRIMIRHIIPNTIYPIMIMASLDIGAIVLTAAALSFLGIGAPYGYTDWGQLISLSREKIWGGAINPLRNWYTFIIPGVFIATFTLGWNLLGDAFRDILDATLRRK
jgi:peptide/nickel transport system permease protein